MNKQLQILIAQLRVASEIWREIQNESMPADRWLGNYFHRNRKRFGSKDRKFYAELIYAYFRHKTYIELWSEFIAKKSGAKRDFVSVLIAGYLGAVISSESFAELMSEREFTYRWIELIDEAKLPDNRLLSLANQYSMPEWLVSKWQGEMGDQSLEALLKAQGERPPFVVRANLLKGTRADLLGKLEVLGHEVRAGELSETSVIFTERANLFSSQEFRKGLFEVQDEGSQFLCELLDPQPGEVLWDVCAGGGGKSLALAALMKNKGRVIATDIRELKLEDLKKRAKRAGAFNIFPASLSRLDELKLMQKGVDKILVDAPCSGTGTLRRNPDVKWKLTPEIFEKHHKDQVEITVNAAKFLKAGGLLAYATCSVDASENEATVSAILASEAGLKQIPLSETPAGARHALSVQTPQGTLKLTPQEHKTDGFFMALFRKLD